MPHPVDVIWGKYVRACMTYGLLHSLPYAYAMKKPLCAGMEEEEALLADRVGCCIMGAVVAPALWPVYLYKDARAVERLIRQRV